MKHTRLSKAVFPQVSEEHLSEICDESWNKNIKISKPRNRQKKIQVPF